MSLESIMEIPDWEEIIEAILEIVSQEQNLDTKEDTTYSIPSS